MNVNVHIKHKCNIYVYVCTAVGLNSLDEQQALQSAVTGVRLDNKKRRQEMERRSNSIRWEEVVIEANENKTTRKGKEGRKDQVETNQSPNYKFSLCSFRKFFLTDILVGLDLTTNASLKQTNRKE